MTIGGTARLDPTGTIGLCYVVEFDCNRRMMFVSASEEKRGMTFVYSSQDASVTTANLNLLQLDSPPWRPTQLAHSYVCVSVDSALIWFHTSPCTCKYMYEQDQTCNTQQMAVV